MSEITASPPTEPIEGDNYEGVAGVQRGQGAVELGAARSSAQAAVVDVEVVAADSGGEQIRLLSTKVLPAKHQYVPDQLVHASCPNVIS